MKLALILLGIVTIMELLSWLKPIWRIRRYWVSLTIVSLCLAAGLVFGQRPNVWTLLLLSASVYRAINLLRLVEGRTDADYLYKVAVRTSLTLIAWQAVLFGLYELGRQHKLNFDWLLGALAVVQLIAAAIILLSTLRHLRKSSPPTIKANYANRDLPSISVAIPARNETEDLEGCLNSLVGSDYPKLEILVLDDCSQNKQTPEIIKSFAQAGVRFVEGELPPENWLAKNYAYYQLSQQASGQLILFCGVDARFDTRSLRALVECLIEKKKSMISVMPVNRLDHRLRLSRLLVQPCRYAWEMALPRRLLKRPPVLSTCWLIGRDVLQRAGGFKAAQRSVSIESYFARRCIAQKDGYSFLSSADKLGVTSTKTTKEQIDTAIRTRYPQMHRRPELVYFASLAEVTILLAPIYSLIAGICLAAPLIIASGCLSLVLLGGFYFKVVDHTYNQTVTPSLLMLPLAALYDIGLLNYSMWQYEFGEVIWKGRNVCLPIMRATPTLPKTP